VKRREKALERESLKREKERKREREKERKMKKIPLVNIRR